MRRRYTAGPRHTKVPRKRGALYMAKFAEANLDIVAVELEFFAKRDKECKKKDEKEMDHKNFVEVNEMFGELKREGFYEERRMM